MATAKPNALGRMLRYFAAAVAYARQPAAKAQQYPSRRNPLVTQLLTSNRIAPSGGSDANVEYFSRLAVTSPYFYAAVTTIADRIADVAAFTVEEQQGDQWVEIPNHPFLSVLESPNAFMPGPLLLSTVSMWLDTFGECYLFLATEGVGYGDIQEVWLLPSDKTEPDPLTLRISPITGQPIIDYKYTLNVPITLPGENVIHIKTANLFDFWRGLSPLTAMQGVLQMDSSQTNWLASYFSEGNAVPTAVISLPPEISDDEFDAVKRDIIENFGAARRSAITRAGDIDVETIQHTIEEMQVLVGLEYNANAIQAVLKVPKGLRDGSSGQSRLAADMALMRDAIQPKLDMLASFFTLRAMPFYFRGNRLRVVAKDIVPQDAAIATAEYATYSPDRTLNENREVLKLPPLFLTGELQKLQQLFDEVPQRYVELMLPILSPPPMMPGMGMPGIPGMEMPGQQAGGGQMGPGAQTPMPQRPGLPKLSASPAPKPQNGKPPQLGQRTTGLQRPSGVRKLPRGALSGKSLLDSLESEGAQGAVKVMLADYGLDTGDSAEGLSITYYADLDASTGQPVRLYRGEWAADGEAWAAWDSARKAWTPCGPVDGLPVVHQDVVWRALRREQVNAEEHLL